MDKRALNPQIRQAIADFDLDAAPRGAVSRFCAVNGISRSAFYKIRQAAPAGGESPESFLLPRKSGPPVPPLKTGPGMERLVIDLRRELKREGWGCGPVSVRARLIRAGHQNVPSRATLARIFTRYGLVAPEPKKRPRSANKRFCYPKANDMWQLDGTEWRLDDEANTKQVIYQVEDDHSRMILAWAVDATENGPTAIKVVSEAISDHGVPVRFLTDNANAFNMSRRGRTAPLERYLQAFGVKTISGSVAHPETQGKNERLHSTLLQFLRAHQPILTADRLAELLAEFADKYNNERPHQELPDQQTPAEAYAAAAKADPPNPPPPAQPDLFDAAADPAGRPAQPPRQRPHRAYELGGILWADRKVAADGKVSIAHCRVQVGRRRAGEVLHIAITDDHLEFFGPDGDALGLVTRPPKAATPTRINLFSEGIYCG
jgi:transposase InsO family protein